MPKKDAKLFQVGDVVKVKKYDCVYEITSVKHSYGIKVLDPGKDSMTKAGDFGFTPFDYAHKNFIKIT